MSDSDRRMVAAISECFTVALRGPYSLVLLANERWRWELRRQVQFGKPARSRKEIAESLGLETYNPLAEQWNRKSILASLFSDES